MFEALGYGLLTFIGIIVGAIIYGVVVVWLGSRDAFEEDTDE